MSGFKEFLVKTNALALAIAFIIGLALSAVVTSLVNDIIMPPIGLALGGIDFSKLRIILQDNADPTKVVAINYGAFINAIIAFIVIAFVAWWLSRLFIKEEEAAPVKTCPFCKTDNAEDASKCKACASAI
ncbi:MAG: large conductance mechanosensitive channel protein MscL [Chloroflexota bacterium]|nr:MAG: large conductance mechanosensitive channel protein MscL [Chloroflexota bacterium]